jgi:hypothetical protein
MLDITTSLPTKKEIAAARLPATYEQAKVALASCAKIDECQEWANKAEALASYAKMADDDALRTMADRIQARAVRRMGELLKQFDGRGGDRSKKNGAVPSAPTQRQAADKAGISERQRKTAVAVANVPSKRFEEAVEKRKPPTVTALAEMGKQARAVPEGFKQATHLIGAVKRFAEFCRENAAESVARGVHPTEIKELKSHVGVIDAWLDLFVVNLKG